MKPTEDNLIMNPSMKITHQKPKPRLNKNGCYEHTEADIYNLPYIHSFSNEAINKLIVSGCAFVLSMSKDDRNKFKYGEIGLLISYEHLLDISHNQPIIWETFLGDYGSVSGLNQRFIDIASSRNIGDLVFIHNHPNNSWFSGNDLMFLVRNKNIRAMVAVGNTSNLHIILNTLTKDVEDYIAKAPERLKNNSYKLTDKQAYDIAANEIRDNVDKFNIHTETYRRLAR